MLKFMGGAAGKTDSFEVTFCDELEFDIKSEFRIPERDGLITALCDTSFDQEETSTQHCVFPVFPIDQNSIPNRFTGENSDYSVENFKFAVEMYLGNQSTQNIHLVDDYDKITWIGNLLANGGQVSV